MTMAVMLIALLTGVTVWWLLIQKLQTKPWAEQGLLDQPPHGLPSMPAPRVGLRVFLAVVTSIFAVFIVAYIMRMSHSHGGHDWTPLAEPGLLWLNTGLLVGASVAFQRARNAFDHGRLEVVKPSLAGGGLLTIGFLAGQLLAWRELNQAGAFLTSGPASAFFYLLTAVHGLHLLGGLWVWARTTAKVWVLRVADGDAAQLTAAQLTIELCTVYWHYLLLVWLVLFGLLLMT